MNSRAEKIEAIRVLPAELNAAVKGLSDKQLDTPYRNGGWTPRQIVHHIADSHMNAFIRMKLILAEDRPTLKPYSQDDWAKTSDYTVGIEPSLAIVSGVQERMANLLENLREEEWSRMAYHPENGDITLDDLLNLYSGHGRHHIKQIMAVR
jgi:hypothetical protein